jgi:hypothetical protein
MGLNAVSKEERSLRQMRDRAHILIHAIDSITRDEIEATDAAITAYFDEFPEDKQRYFVPYFLYKKRIAEERASQSKLLNLTPQEDAEREELVRHVAQVCYVYNRNGESLEDGFQAVEEWQKRFPGDPLIDYLLGMMHQYLSSEEEIRGDE